MLVLAIALPATSFGGLVGILPASAFIGSEITLFLFATAGLMFIGLNDDGLGRRPIVLHRAPVAISLAAPVGPARPRISYGLRRRPCSVL